MPGGGSAPMMKRELLHITPEAGGCQPPPADSDNPDGWFSIPPGEIRQALSGELDWSDFKTDPRIYLKGHAVGRALVVFPNGGLHIKIDHPMVRAAFRARPEPLWAVGYQRPATDTWVTDQAIALGDLFNPRMFHGRQLVVRCLIFPDDMLEIDPFLLAVGDRLRETDTDELDRWITALTSP